MDKSPFNRLSGELRNKIYDMALRHEPQEIVLNLTKWQVTLRQRPEVPNKNVTQYGISITQTCRAMRDETLKLFYFTNTLVLDMADFENHISPILTPPREATEKLRDWRNLAGGEAVQAVRKIDIKLHYHYLGSGSKLRLDTKAAAILKDVFHSDTAIFFHITVHLPVPDDLMGGDGRPVSGLGVVWMMGESATVWRDRATLEAKSLFKRFMEATGLTPHADRYSRLLTIFQTALAFLHSGIPSIQAYTAKPFFGPILPPVMEAEREAVARASREEAWAEQRNASRIAVMGDDAH